MAKTTRLRIRRPHQPKTLSPHGPPRWQAHRLAGAHPRPRSVQAITEPPGRLSTGRFLVSPSSTAKKPLSPNTLRRIAAGLKKFGGENANPFLIKLYGTNDVASVDEPLPTVTAGGNHLGVVQPFILPHPRKNGDEPRSIDEPVQTITATSCDMMLVEPFLVHTNHEGGDRCHSLDEPIPTVTGAHRGEMALVEPFLVPYHSGQGREDERAHSLDEPLRTVDTQNRHALVQPFLVNMKGQSNAASIDQPTPTITAHARHLALCQPFLLGQHSGGSPRSVQDPVPTITTDGAIALVEPFVTKYYGTGTAKSVNQPLDTVTAKDRFCLIEPEARPGCALDIRLRMLQPNELAAAMSFPRDYKFYGTKEQQVKQIGNAVPVELARAHARALLA